MSAPTAEAATRLSGAEQNGHEPFPVDSYREAATHLRRPFTPMAVKFKVQATWPKDAPTGGLIVPYIDARLAQERLNLVCPHLWSPRYEHDDKSLWCHLTIDGITRSDLGEGYVGKGLVSDAFKRAAVTFGVGRSLYATPKITLSKSDGLLKDARSRSGPTLQLTEKGERRCRELYATWLAERGEAAFGKALDHGDAEDSVGDTEEGGSAPAASAPRTPSREEATTADAEAELRLLLATADPLQAKRRYADEGMKNLGAAPAQRLRELKSAPEARTLDELIARIDAAADVPPEEPPIA